MHSKFKWQCRCPQSHRAPVTFCEILSCNIQLVKKTLDISSGMVTGHGCTAGRCGMLVCMLSGWSGSGGIADARGYIAAHLSYMLMIVYLISVGN